MKKTIVLTLLFLALLPASGQIAIESFRLLETDLTAITNGTQETDQNGDVAALIKVVTTQKDFTFDGGMLGIVRTIVKPGEYWVYVPRKLQRISIAHPELGILRDYYFPLSIEGGRTYELRLTSSRVKTIVEEDAGGGFLSLTVAPTNAVVYVDDALQALDADGTLSLFLLYGEHTWRVEAPGYRPQSGKVEFVTEETKEITVTLMEISRSAITFVTDMADAEIWVNNRQQGVGKWTGELNAGNYIVETRKAGHRSQRTTISVADGEERTVTLDAPVPMVGRLRTESKPSGADVFLGENRLGRTPGIFSDLLIGSHTLTFRKEGYLEQTADVTIEEGKIAPVSVTLERDPQAVAEEEAAKQQKKEEEAAKQQAREEDKARKNAEKQERAAREAEARQAAKDSSTKDADTSARLLRKTSFYVDAHFGLGSPMAAGASLGAYLGGFNIEGFYDVAMGSGRNVTWYKEDSNGAYQSVTMTYNPASILGGYIGYGISVGNRLRLTPRLGAGVLAINGTGAASQKTFIFSGSASLKAEFAVSKLLSLYVAPAYNIPLQRGATAEQLQGSVTEFSKWNSGISARIGLSLNF